MTDHEKLQALAMCFSSLQGQDRAALKFLVCRYKEKRFDAGCVRILEAMTSQYTLLPDKLIKEPDNV